MNAKGRRKNGADFLALPRAVLRHENFLSLSHKSVRLLIDISMQFTGKNNGDLCASMSVMKKRGWGKSKSSLQNALEELVHYGLIELTRQGGLNRASLYAITWREIHDCGGKLEVRSTIVASGKWREHHPPFVPKRKRTPPLDSG